MAIGENNRYRMPRQATNDDPVKMKRLVFRSEVLDLLTVRYCSFV
jgi:hypothetical protein